MKLFLLIKDLIFGLMAVISAVVVLFGVSLLLVLLVLMSQVVPAKAVQKMLRVCAEKVALWWVVQNHWCLSHLTSIDWQIEGVETINPTKNYLVISNHQSWSDIPVLEYALYQRTGFSRYFIKKNILKVPLVGWACKAMNFPAMHRFSKSMLIKNPNLRGKDTEITKRSCAQLKGVHFKLNNFTEGTRFTVEKHQRQQSPYRHLLVPRAGGVSFALHSLHDQLDGILNVTIVYEGPKKIWALYFSRIKKIRVIVEKIPISADLIGDYQEDRAFRVHFQKWLNALWLKKDQLF